jgi:hypothetical protein
MMVASERAFCKAREIMEKMISFVEKASREEERIDRVERELFFQLLQLGGQLLAAFIKESGDGDVGQRIEQDGGILRRFKKKGGRVYRSIFGVLKVHRWVYGRRESQKCYAPLDARLGLPAGEQSYVLEDWMQRFSVQNAFSHAVSSLSDLLGIKSSVRTAERINREMGQLTAAYRTSQPPIDQETEAEILVTTADGKGVPMRRTLEEQVGKKAPAWRRFQEKRQQIKAGERAKKRRGRGQVKTRKQMAYVGAVYTISPWIRTADDLLDEISRTRQKIKRPQVQNKRVWAEMTHYEEDERVDGQPHLFAGLAWEVCQRDPQGEKPLVCLMDGQRSLWNLKDQWLSRAVGILDIFHATEWLWKTAYCFHKEGSRTAEEFVTHYLRMFLEGKVGYAIGSLRRKTQDLKGAKQKTLQDAIRYFSNNCEYMRYDAYLRAGYPIGSGVVEGACRHLVRDRMERTGMRWDVTGAQAMLDTRSTYVNQQWDDFIEYRIETEQARLYAQAA